MKTQIEIGDGLMLDIPTLLKTRLLIQANSGGGKSYLLRRLAEQLCGKVPVIIIDVEGEFATLREKYDYVLVGKGGETPADIRSVTVVAHKLLELRASAVCDLYELKPQTRHQWVKMFLEALIDAPKELWGPTVVIVDEAHQFCPEGKAGESEASGAMVDLATRGRKRGYCAIFATQRLGKLRKDAAAELLNVMVGMTFIDIDRERAAECLGVGREEKHAFNNEIKLLTEGKFNCLGRAICKERTLIKVGKAETTHPEAGGGEFAATPPPAPAKIRSMLPKLADLPKAAEEKAKTEAELRQTIATLKTKLTLAEKAQPAPAATKAEEVPFFSDKERAVIVEAQKSVSNVQIYIEEKIASVAHKLTEIERAAMQRGRNEAHRYSPPVSLRVIQPTKKSPAVYRKDVQSANGELPSGERKILTAAAQYPEGATREQLTILTGFKRSTRDAYVARLKEKEYLTDNGNSINATESGVAALGPSFEPLPTGQDLIEYWRNKLPQGERSIFEIAISNYPNPVVRDALEEPTGFKRSTRDAYISRMIARRVINAVGRGEIKASDQFFQ